MAQLVHLFNIYSTGGETTCNGFIHINWGRVVLTIPVRDVRRDRGMKMVKTNKILYCI